MSLYPENLTTYNRYQSYMYSASGADSVMENDVGNAYHIMIIIKLKHKYVVVENMKFNSNR